MDVRLGRPLPRDAWLAGVLAVAAVAAMVGQPLTPQSGVTRTADVLGVVLSLAMTLPLAWRRSAPLPALGVAGIAAIVASTTGYEVTVGALVVWLTVGSAALHTDARVARALVAIGAAAVAGSVMVFSPESRTLLGVVSAAGVGALPPLVGDALRRQRELLAEVRALQTRELERVRSDERVAIARDVHDAVGHHLSAIALQAGAARLTAGGPQAEAPAVVFARIARLSEGALRETGAILGTLRGPGDRAPLRPVSRLSDLPGLVESSAAAGVELELTTRGELATVPDAVQAAAYRIAQEALTNVARHAAPPRAALDVQASGALLSVVITDAGRAARPWREGRGLVGMRERAASLGGTVVAGPREPGGWQVRAELPL